MSHRLRLLTLLVSPSTVGAKELGTVDERYRGAKRLTPHRLSIITRSGAGCDRIDDCELNAESLDMNACVCPGIPVATGLSIFERREGVLSSR